MFINDIFNLDKIFDFEKSVEQERNINVANISYWNTSHEYQDYMLRNIILENESNIFDYTYTYDISQDIKKHVAQKLTYKTDSNTMCMITPSSTISIINLINYLKLNNYHKLCIVTPAYFTVEQNCRIFNLPYQKIPLTYLNGNYIIPKEEIIKGDFDVIWLTSPVYSTGISYNQSQIDAIHDIINSQILVIADETLAFPGHELTKTIPISKYFFSICSPHKSLFINSIKFSAVLCPNTNSDFLEQWIDVLGGGLLHSNITALTHFASSNFEHCVQKSYIWYQQGLNAINNVLNSFPSAYCNTEEIGPYKTICLAHAATTFYDIQRLIKEEYISFIPNAYHGFDREDKLCFRVNMSISSPNLQDYLYRILKFYA